MTLLVLYTVLACSLGEAPPKGERGEGAAEEEARTPRSGKKRNKKDRDEKKEDRADGDGRDKTGKRSKPGPPTDALPVFETPCGAREVGSYMYGFEFEGTRYEVPVFIGASKGPRDLVVLLHGGKGNAPSILKKTRFHEKAMREGFVAIAPNATDLAGTGTRWNTGKFNKELEKRLEPGEVPRDDVKYLDALTASLRKRLCVDTVTAIGFSSGGQMTHKWSCKGEQVDMAVTAAGTLLTPDKSCRRPVPVLGFVGTDDDVFTKGPNENDPTQPSAPETIEIWSGQNRCAEGTVESQVQDAICTTYQGCAAPTQLCVVEGMGHIFPAPWAKEPCEFDGVEYAWAWVQGEAKAALRKRKR